MRQANSLMRTKLWMMVAFGLTVLLSGSVAEGGPKAGVCNEGGLICHVTKGDGKVIPICAAHAPGHAEGSHGGDFAPLTFYADSDGDGFGTGAAEVGCALPDGFAVMAGDCDDGDGAINPSAAEICDGVDNDCVGGVDDGNPGSGGTCDTGLDGVCAGGTEQCVAGSLSCEQDALPSAEICDGVDNDCVGGVDDGIADAATGTDVGECQEGRESCIDGSFQVVLEEIGPEAEVCDGLDNDCTGTSDDGIDLASDAATRFDDLVETVFDCATGLEWEKKTEANVNDRYTWTDCSDGDLTNPDGTAFTDFVPAVATALGGAVCASPYDCSSLGLPGPVTCTTPPPDDCWRVPEIDELETILTEAFPDCTSPLCIDPVFGPTAATGDYWTATSSVGLGAAWLVNFESGRLVTQNKEGFPCGSATHFRAVRSSP